MRNSKAAEFFQDFVSLFFPGYCLGCGGPIVKGEMIVCTKCLFEMPQNGYHNEIENPLQQRLSLRFPVKYAIALLKFSKNGRVQRLLHELKYKHHPEIGIVFGRICAERLVESGFHNGIDIIIPVPLHSSRKRKRGYNQSAKFAAGISEGLNIPYSDELLVRKLKTDTQTLKTKLNRWENMKGVFGLKTATGVKGSRVLLVDDVVTTGSTLEACSEILFEGGCAEISVACIAEA
jgi:ComF family protein